MVHAFRGSQDTSLGVAARSHTSPGGALPRGVTVATQGADTRVMHGALGHRHMPPTVTSTATHPARFERA
jgi:hypothetical protein